MRCKHFFIFACAILFATSSCTQLQAAASKESTLSVQDRYSLILEAMQKQRFKEVIREGKLMFSEYGNSAFSQDVNYYMGIAYFYLKDYELANRYFSEYLNTHVSPKYFEDALGYKFAIAKKFEEGGKRHVFGWEKMPKLLPGKQIALSIYDEIITTMPRHDLAAESLYRKACLLFSLKEYKQSIESFQILIRRFPKHVLAPESYLGIAQVYLRQCQKQFPDPDFLDLAEINLKRFKEDFPAEPRLTNAEELLSEMREKYAEELYLIAEFYERTKKSQAACIYYKTIIVKYPDTQYAIKSKKHLIAHNESLPSEASKEEDVLVEKKESSNE